MEGLKLAHLLGRGSFGVVYFGTWFGSEVAVKVRRQGREGPGCCFFFEVCTQEKKCGALGRALQGWLRALKPEGERS